MNKEPIIINLVLGLDNITRGNVPILWNRLLIITNKKDIETINNNIIANLIIYKLRAVFKDYNHCTQNQLRAF